MANKVKFVTIKLSVCCSFLNFFPQLVRLVNSHFGQRLPVAK